MCNPLVADARKLARGGVGRMEATIALNKAVALNQLDGDADAVTEAIREAYGPDAAEAPAEAPAEVASTAPGDLADVPSTPSSHQAPNPTEEVATRPDGGASNHSGASCPRLPPWQAVRASNPPKAAPELIEGLLRMGHIGLIVAKAKSSKSWAAVALSIAVVTGGEWFGHRCQRGRVLFVDPELDPRSLDRRFHKAAEAMGADATAADADVARLSLRGVTVADRGAARAATLADVAHDLNIYLETGSLRQGDLALIVLDSCGALLAGMGDENSSGDVRAFFNVCLGIARATGAAVLLVHHEGKARSGDRDAADRGRGSSVWTDAPDLVLSLVETFPPSGEASNFLQKGERAFVLEVAAIREFPPADPLRLIWRYPLLVEDAEGVTDGWKPRSSAQTAGRASGDARRVKSQERAVTCTMALLAHMYRHGTDSAEGIPASEAAEICSEAVGTPIKAQTLKAYVEQSEWLDVYQRSPQRWAVVPRHPRPAAAEAGASASCGD